MLIDIHEIGIDDERLTYLVKWVSKNINEGDNFKNALLKVLKSEVVNKEEAFVLGLIVMEILTQTVTILNERTP